MIVTQEVHSSMALNDIAGFKLRPPYYLEPKIVLVDIDGSLFMRADCRAHALALLRLSQEVEDRYGFYPGHRYSLRGEWSVPTERSVDHLILLHDKPMAKRQEYQQTAKWADFLSTHLPGRRFQFRYVS